MLPVWLALQKAWLFVRKYWQIFAAILGLVLAYIILRRPAGAAIGDIIDRINAQHQADLQILQQRDQNVAQQDAKIEADKQAQLDAIQKQYDSQRSQLDAATQKQADQIIAQSNGDPDVLAKQLADLIGAQNLQMPK